MSGQCLSPSIGGRAPTPPIRRRLGKPLPYQLADRVRTTPRAEVGDRMSEIGTTSNNPNSNRLSFFLFQKRSVRGISSPFGELCLALGYVTRILLIRLPL